MGADLIICGVAMPKGVDLKTEKTKRLNEVDTLVFDKARNNIKEFIESVGDYDEEYTDDQIRNMMKQTVINFFDTLESFPRDISFIEHKGETIYITGGMSWGDDPTDSYKSFSDYAYLEDIFFPKP